MAKIQMDYVGRTLKNEDISQFEKRIGYSLPESYRRFLLKFNGGRPTPYYFTIPKSYDPNSMINEFFGIMAKDENVLDNDIEEYIEIFEFRIPQGFIPIARDPGGNTILLSLVNSTRGSIYFWDHENEPDDYSDNVEDYPNIYLLADDFNKFLDTLSYSDT